MLKQKSLVIMFPLFYVVANYGSAAFAPLLPVDSLLLTTTAATLLDTTYINDPGNYYLYVDLDGPLVINASPVIINMSGNTINGGITLTQAAETVAVYNGFVNGAGAVGATILGGVRNILFSQILFLNCSTGIQANGTFAEPIKRIALDQVEVQGATANGVDLTYCQEFLVDTSTFFGNANYGLYLQNCNRGLVDSCSFTNNGASGMFIDVASNIKFVNNSSTLNGGDGYFFGPNAQIITANNCNASNNILSGFLVQGRVSVIECVANNNAADGFVIQTAQTTLLRACQATNNAICGFNDLSSSNVSYVSNLAHGNGNDYCSLSVPVIAGAAPYYYASITAGAMGVSSWTNVQA